jgi:hypothetical protein
MAPTSYQVYESLTTPMRLHLAALLLGQTGRLPVSPTKRMTLSLMGELRNASLIQVPPQGACWDFEPSAEQTPMEKLPWRPIEGAGQLEERLSLLTTALERVPLDDQGMAVRVELWTRLACGEAVSFFENQLSKHQFDVAWAEDLVYAQRKCPQPLSIAKWRYCCWAATRHGASVALQQRTPDATLVREAIFDELNRRAQHMLAGAWSDCSFPPYVAEPVNALGKLFVRHLAPIGMAYWTRPPSHAGLIAPD